MKEIIDLGVTLSGRFKLEAIRPDGTIRELADWFPNLITNSGLDHFGTITSDWMTGSTSPCRECSVGSGNTVPAVTDSGLVTLIATKNGASVVKGVDVPGRYLWARATYEFPVGDAAGNLSEIGIGPPGLDLFSRALILDGASLPTTITVLSDEILRASYELRLNIPTGNYPMVVDGYTLDIKAANAAGNPASSSSWGTGTARNVNQNAFFLYNGAVGATIDDAPAGTSDAADTMVMSVYVNGTYTLTYSAYWGVNSANFDVSAFRVGLGPSEWQSGVSPVITKTNLKELTIVFRLTWAREGEL